MFNIIRDEHWNKFRSGIVEWKAYGRKYGETMDETPLTYYIVNILIEYEDAPIGVVWPVSCMLKGCEWRCLYVDVYHHAAFFTHNMDRVHATLKSLGYARSASCEGVWQWAVHPTPLKELL